MDDEAAFLREVIWARKDPTPRLVYADWLDERGDPRAAYLRAEASADGPAREGLLRERATGLDPVWVARVSRPPVGVCVDHVRIDHNGPLVDAAEVARVEERLGVELPVEYRAFLLNYNGGVPVPGQFRLEGVPPRCSRVERFWAASVPTSGAVPGPAEGVPADYRDWVPTLEFESFALLRFPGNAIANLLPVGDTGDDDYLLLGVAGEEAGRVYEFFDYTHNWEDPERLIAVVPSFPDLLARLTSFVLPQVRLIEEWDDEGLVRWLDAGGDAGWEDPDTGESLVTLAIQHARPAAVRAPLMRGSQTQAELRALLQTARDYRDQDVIDAVRAFIG